MADYANLTTFAVRLSTGVLKTPWSKVTRLEATAINAIPRLHRKVVAGHVVTMDAAEIAAADAAADSADKDARTLRVAATATVKALAKQVNVLRVQAGLSPLSAAQWRALVRAEV